MMIPIALKVAQSMEKEGVDIRMFAPALALAIAYSASIGGLGTPVGTPSNLIGIGYLENTLERTISFPQWMMIGLPAVSTTGEALGTVVLVDNFGAGDILEIERPNGKRFMVPMNRDAVPEWTGEQLTIAADFAA